MTNFNMKALVAALIASCANGVCAMDASFDSTATTTTTSTEDASGADSGSSTSGVSATSVRATVATAPKTKPKMAWETYLLNSETAIVWAEEAKFTPPHIQSPLPKSGRLTNFFTAVVSQKKLQSYNIPLTPGGKTHGMSTKWPLNSYLYSEAFKTLRRSLNPFPKFLNLAAGHAFVDMALFSINVAAELHSMDLSVPLVDLYKHLYSMFMEADPEKAKLFSYVYGDATNSEHPLFREGVYELITAFNLIHYLPKAGIDSVLKNVHGSLAANGKAIFTCSSNPNVLEILGKDGLPQLQRSTSLFFPQLGDFQEKRTPVSEDLLGTIYMVNSILATHEEFPSLFRATSDLTGNAREEALQMLIGAEKKFNTPLVADVSDLVGARLFTQRSLNALFERSGLFDIVESGYLNKLGGREIDSRKINSVYAIVKPRKVESTGGATATAGASVTASAADTAE